MPTPVARVSARAVRDAGAAVLEATSLRDTAVIAHVLDADVTLVTPAGEVHGSDAVMAQLRESGIDGGTVAIARGRVVACDDGSAYEYGAQVTWRHTSSTETVTRDAAVRWIAAVPGGEVRVALLTLGEGAAVAPDEARCLPRIQARANRARFVVSVTPVFPPAGASSTFGSWGAARTLSAVRRDGWTANPDTYGDGDPATGVERVALAVRMNLSPRRAVELRSIGAARTLTLSNVSAEAKLDYAYGARTFQLLGLVRRNAFAAGAGPAILYERWTLVDRVWQPGSNTGGYDRATYVGRKSVPALALVASWSTAIAPRLSMEAWANALLAGPQRLPWTPRFGSATLDRTTVVTGVSLGVPF